MKKRGKTVVISSLAVRFYRHHGWTEKLLREYVRFGELVKMGKENDDFDRVYWLPDVGAKMDIERMFSENEIGKVIDKDRWGETKGMTDIEAVKERVN